MINPYTLVDPTWRIMGLSKHGYKYLKWEGIISIVTFIITLVTKSNDPDSKP